MLIAVHHFIGFFYLLIRFFCLIQYFTMDGNDMYSRMVLLHCSQVNIKPFLQPNRHKINILDRAPGSPNPTVTNL